MNSGVHLTILFERTKAIKVRLDLDCQLLLRIVLSYFIYTYVFEPNKQNQ